MLYKQHELGTREGDLTCVKVIYLDHGAHTPTTNTGYQNPMGFFFSTVYNLHHSLNRTSCTCNLLQKDHYNMVFIIPVPGYIYKYNDSKITCKFDKLFMISPK